MPKHNLLVLSAAFTAIVLAACGGSETSESNDITTDSAVTLAEHTAGETNHEFAAEALPTKQVDFVDNFVLLDQDGTAHDL